MGGDTHTWQGSCHCGRTRFQITADIDHIRICDCSICYQRGALNFRVEESQFQLLTPLSDLALYEWGTGTAKDYFCKTCGILPFRRTKGLPGYTYLQPVTSEQIASARMLANALLLLPTVALVMVFHFTLPGTTFITEIIPQALDLGVTSFREVVWVLLSRGICVGLASWMLLTISTRMFIPIMAVSVMILPVIWGLGYRGDSEMWYLFFLCESIFLVSICISSFIRAWKLQLISPRTIFIWAGIWALVSWVLLGFFVASIPGPYPPLL